MSHFAELDENNIVVRVLVVHDSEAALWPVAPFTGRWKQCSYNGNIRKQYPGVGYLYDSVADVFVAPQPFPSWTLDADHDWQPPTPRPDGVCQWDEAALAWVTV